MEVICCFCCIAFSCTWATIVTYTVTCGFALLISVGFGILRGGLARQTKCGCSAVTLTNYDDKHSQTVHAVLAIFLLATSDLQISGGWRVQVYIPALAGCSLERDFVERKSFANYCVV